MNLGGGRMEGATLSLGGWHGPHLVQGDPHGSTSVTLDDHINVAILYVRDDDGIVHDDETLPRWQGPCRHAYLHVRSCLSSRMSTTKKMVAGSMRSRASSCPSLRLWRVGLSSTASWRQLVRAGSRQWTWVASLGSCAAQLTSVEHLRAPCRRLCSWQRRVPRSG